MAATSSSLLVRALPTMGLLDSLTVMTSTKARGTVWKVGEHVMCFIASSSSHWWGTDPALKFWG